jgi:dTDP-L-rhamnose 4-epimerase
MKVLVTGGAGFIGSHTVDLLVDRGDEVRVLDNLQARVHPDGIPSWLSPKAELCLGDAADPRHLREALADVDRVIHLAAYQDYQPDFHRFIHTNTESAALLYEIVVRDRLPVRKIVHASSQAVAGEGLYRCAEHGEATPPPRSIARLRSGVWDHRCQTCDRTLEPTLILERVTDPHTAYAVSKLGVELLAGSLGTRYDIPSVAMRYTYVQGPRNSPHNAYSGIARRFGLALLAGRAPVCFEDGRQLRDFVNVRDVARANLLALDTESADGVYNVGGGAAVSVLEFAELMIAAAGAQVVPVVTGQFRVGDTRHTVSDLTRMTALGWRPTVPVAQNAAEYLDWLRQQRVDPESLDRADEEMVTAGVLRSVEP